MGTFDTLRSDAAPATKSPLGVCEMTRRVCKQLLLVGIYILSCHCSIIASFTPLFREVSSLRSGRHRHAFSLNASMKHRMHFNTAPVLRQQGNDDPPKLILISGGPGTGKSTFGMSLALEQGILKCISTDTIRAVMRSYVPESISPPLHRSSYGCASEDGTDDPVKSWIETCKVLESSIEGLVVDAIRRGVSLVLEGVSIRPSKKYIDMFNEAGGTACGVLLVVSDNDRHKSLLNKRGFITGNINAEEHKLESFDRIRLIQDEMIRSAKESGWVLIEQRIEPDPLDVVADELYKVNACKMKDMLMDKLDEDCVLPLASTGGDIIGGSNVSGESRSLIDDLFREVGHIATKHSTD